VVEAEAEVEAVDATLGEGAAVSPDRGVTRSRAEYPRGDRLSTAPGRAHVIRAARKGTTRSSAEKITIIII
jgi:hypothetical protein